MARIINAAILKVWSTDPCGYSKLFLGSPKGQNCSHDDTKKLLLLFAFTSVMQKEPGTGGKLAGTLVPSSVAV